MKAPLWYHEYMNQPKNLNSSIEYSGDIYIPEIDMDLDEFVKSSNEHIQSYKIHNRLKDYGIEYIGEDIFLDEELEIDLNQFEERQEIPKQPSKKSFLKKFVR